MKPHQELSSTSNGNQNKTIITTNSSVDACCTVAVSNIDNNTTNNTNTNTNIIINNIDINNTSNINNSNTVGQINNSTVVDNNIFNKKSSKCKLVKSIKPLVNYKFYLDIERHNTLLQIETKIRELGGSTGFFLTKDITHFITDKKEIYNRNNGDIVDSSQLQHQSPGSLSVQTPQTPLTTNYLSPIVKTPNSNDLKTNKKLKNRADAMLHRARKGTCETVIDNNRKSIISIPTSNNTSGATIKNPSQIAKSWGTPVWHTEYALKFLEKVYLCIKERYNNPNYKRKKLISSSLKNKTKKAQIFKGNYIKIESIQKHYRPYFKIFTSKWPVLSLKPHKKGVFPLSEAANEIYFYDSETKQIKKQKSINKTKIGAKVIKIPGEESNVSTLIPVVAESLVSTQASSIKMTRKAKNIRSKTAAATTTTTTTATTNASNKLNSSLDKQCGFCEICRVEYDALTIHLKSESHLNFVKNENNFLALDSLITSSTNMDKFLSINNKTNIEFDGKNCDLYSTAKRTSKRILNNGSSLKPASLSSISETLLHSPKNVVNVEKPLLPRHDNNYYNQDHQIEILEKTTTLGHTRQTRQQPLMNNSIKNDQQENNIRAKRQSAKKINYAESKEEEENSSVDEMVFGYQRKKKPKVKEKIIDSSPEVKQLTLPTSLLYKVVETNVKNDKTSKKSSKKTEKNLIVTEAKEKQIDEKLKKDEQPIIVKIRKVRQSELSVLSGEAVNFMFPKRRISSEPTDIDRQTTSERKEMECSNSGILSSSPNTRKNNKLEESVFTEEMTTLKRKHSISSELETALEEKVRKKRRLKLNHSENENEENEKNSLESASVIENINENRLSPKLSLQENISLRTYKKRKTSKKKNVLKCKKKSPTTKKAKESRKNMPKKTVTKNLINEKLSQYKFSFERIPENELWYDVFRRQDLGSEVTFEYYGSTNYRKLPYEMGPLLFSTNASCSLCLVKTSKNNVESDKTVEKMLKPNEKEDSEKKECCSSNISNSELKSPIKNNLKKIKKSVKSNRVASLLNLEMPRKSPREHASTLANLSYALQKKIAQQQQEVKITSPKKYCTKQKIKNESVVSEDVNSSNTNSEICTQISEDVKRLRRGERVPTATYSKNLLESRKKNIKQANGKKINSVLLLSSSSTKKKPLQFDVDENYLKKSLKQEKHVNVTKLKQDIDSFLSSSITNGVEYEKEFDAEFTNNQVDDMDNFMQCSNNFDLCDLIEENKDYNFSSLIKSSSQKSSSLYFGGNNFSNRLSFCNKKRKNKTGWPTVKKRTSTRQHAFQQQKEKVQGGKINSKCSLEKIRNTVKSEESENSEKDISSHSPITPPESDDHEGNEDDDIDDANTFKDDCDASVNGKIINNGIHHNHCHSEQHQHNQQTLLLPPPSHNHHSHNLSASERTDVSDIFTVSSDSLDTVLDVGSQIKSEDQEEIIAISKCNGNKLNGSHCNNVNNQNDPISDSIEEDDDINDTDSNVNFSMKKIKKPFSFNKKLKLINFKDTEVISTGSKDKITGNITNNCHNNNSKINFKNTPNNHTTIKNVKVLIKEKRSLDDMLLETNLKTNSDSNTIELDKSLNENSSSTPQLEMTNTNINNNNNNNTTINISPRRLRKPRGKWYRER